MLHNKIKNGFMKIINNLSNMTINALHKGKCILSDVYENISNRIKAIYERHKFDPASWSSKPRIQNTKILYRVKPEFSEAEKLFMSKTQEKVAITQEIRAFNEIITTEQSFSASLQKAVTLLGVLSDPEACCLTYTEKQELEGIRDDYYQTLILSKQLCRQFNHLAGEKSLTFDQKEVQLADLYKSEDFKNYAEALEKCISDLETGKIYKAQLAYTKNLKNGEDKISDLRINLNPAIITPVQRFPRHEMLLQNLKGSISSSSQGYANILNALSEIDQLKEIFKKK